MKKKYQVDEAVPIEMGNYLTSIYQTNAFSFTQIYLYYFCGRDAESDLEEIFEVCSLSSLHVIGRVGWKEEEFVYL